MSVPAIVWCCPGGPLPTTQVQSFHNSSLQSEVRDQACMGKRNVHCPFKVDATTQQTHVEPQCPMGGMGLPGSTPELKTRVPAGWDEA